MIEAAELVAAAEPTSAMAATARAALAFMLVVGVCVELGSPLGIFFAGRTQILE